MNSFCATVASSDISDTGLAVPLGIALKGHFKNGATHMNGADEDGHGKADGAAQQQETAVIGHNSKAADLDTIIDDFDAIAASNLKRGLYRTQAECWRLASNDPRCTWRHLRVLGIVFGFLSSTTATAFPGWKAIAAETVTFSGGVPDPSGGYSHGTIRNILSDLQQWGYLPSGGQRKGYGRLTVYTVGTPSLEKLAREIATHMGVKAENAPKERERIKVNLGSRRVTTPDDALRVTGRDDTSLGVTGGGDTSAGRVTGRVTGGREQELERELEEKTLSSAGAGGACATEDLFAGGVPLQGGAPSDKAAHAAKGEPCKPTKAEPDDEAPTVQMSPACWQALAAYNDAAAEHRFTPCKSPTDTQAKRLAKRISGIGGVRRFQRALSALPLHDFLMGRVAGKGGNKPFRLNFDRLLSTDSGMGDVLGVLLGLADERDVASSRTVASNRETALKQLAETPEGKRVLQRYGQDEGMQRLGAIITKSEGGA